MKKLGFVVALAAFLPGCSTMLNGTHQGVNISSNPPDAYCELSRQSEGMLNAVNTPERVYIPRDSESLIITCERKGYKKSVFVIPSIPRDDIHADSIAATGGVMWGAGVLLADIANHSSYALPTDITVDLEKE